MNIINIEIEDMIKLMKENDLGQLKIKKGKLSIEISRNNQNFIPVTNTQSQVSSTSIIKDPSSSKSGEDENFRPVKSPLVGTFFSASAPDKGPFVKVGDKIEKGEILCIVEAMKSMNEIKADFSGTILEICAENAQPVEYKQILFKIKN